MKEKCCKCGKEAIVNEKGDCFVCASLSGTKYVQKKKILSLQLSQAIWLVTGVLDIGITCLILYEARLGLFATGTYALMQGAIIIFALRKEAKGYYYGREAVNALNLLTKVMLFVDIPYFFSGHRLDLGGFCGKELETFIRTRIEISKVMPGLSGLIQLLSEYFRKYLMKPIIVQVGLVALWMIINKIVIMLKRDSRLDWQYLILNRVLEKEESFGKLEDIPVYKSYHTETYRTDDRLEIIEEAVSYVSWYVGEDEESEEIKEQVIDLLYSNEEKLEMSTEVKKVYYKVVEECILHDLKMDENSQWIDEIEQTKKAIGYPVNIPEVITLEGKHPYVTQTLFELARRVKQEVNEPLETFLIRKKELNTDWWIKAFRGDLTYFFPEYKNTDYSENRINWADGPKVAVVAQVDCPSINYFKLYVETLQLVDEYRHWRKGTKGLVSYAKRYQDEILKGLRSHFLYN